MPSRPTPFAQPLSAPARPRELASLLARGAAQVLDGVTAGLCIEASTALGFERAGSFLWLAVYIYLMVERGQTPGKALVGIHIVGGTGRPVGLIRGAILRNVAVPAMLVALMALVVRLPAVSGTDLDEPTLQMLVAGLVVLSWLPILGPRRRCLHDYIAGTSVEKSR